MRRLEVAERAQADVESLGRWWRENREKAPDLFEQELEIAYSAIQTHPEYGQRYAMVRGQPRPARSLLALEPQSADGRRAQAERGRTWYTAGMTLTARVQNGHPLLDEPTELPEGSAFKLVPADEVYDTSDGLSDSERAYIHERIVASIRDRRAGGETFDADEVMAELAATP